jgi:sulfite dehydrogenase (cytochrome) subunit B
MFRRLEDSMNMIGAGRQSPIRRFFPGCAGAAVLFIAFASQAQPRDYSLPEETTQFLAGPGAETAQVNCTVCHSADYVSTQPRGQGKTFWTAEVNKMFKVFGAPAVSPGDAAKIIDYLSAAY